MDEARLSQRERRILAEMERDLRADTSPEDGSRDGVSPGGGSRDDVWPERGRSPVRRHALAVAVVLLGVLTLGLLVLAVMSGEPALIWAFAVMWVLTLTCLMKLVIRWSRHLKPRSWPT
ncbi:hypothetical protein [Streptomyces sp. NPDC026092]|uniref:hypothetical protein n=1 Tax=Streptomyces sp. NPDC026092 TaxID=3154797 RepID=UPI0033EEAEA8